MESTMSRPLKEDLTGKTYGKLLVVRRNGSNDRGHPLWRCKCDCGAVVDVPGGQLRNGTSKSCGCWRKEFSVVTKTTHGKASKDWSRRSRTYSIWNAMRQRCHNPNQPHYSRYGGRGIEVCEEWRRSFVAFYSDMGDPPTDSHTIDRINNDDGYHKGNCRWATRQEQQKNKRGRPKKRPIPDV